MIYREFPLLNLQDI